MERASIFMRMERGMKDNGLTICNTAMEKIHGQMDLFMREPTWLAKSMVEARIAGAMAPYLQGIGTKTKFQD